MFEPRDPAYPELKKTHTAARVGRPWTDYKPPPAAPVWGVIEGLGRYHTLCAALELGVFDAIERIGPCDAAGLSAELDVSATHLEALVDAVVVMGLLDRVHGRYELNDTTRRYLVTDGPASMASLVPVAPGPHENWGRLADTVRRGRPATPIEDDPAAFYVPLVEGTFTTTFRTASRADLKMRYSALRAPRVLDLGAGGAPWAIAVLSAVPDATAVVNDLPGVVGVAEAKLAEHGVADRAEVRAGDYFEIAIEDDAYDLVVLGHLCRAEPPVGARRLIDRAFRALRPEGRIVLSDYFVNADELGANPHAVLMGTTVMASTAAGRCHSHADISGWLADAGFEAIRLIEPIGFQQAYVATKPTADLH
ncbi:MAG: methyltransferase [Actinomycetota bacterium]|nr:methyltransferase [Actinomycetota bacterium]